MFSRRLSDDSQRFGTLYRFHLHRQVDVVCIDLPMKMEPIEGSETSDISTQTPKKHPKENILHIKHGESLKSSIYLFIYLFILCREGASFPLVLRGSFL
jgi:hypothetical protein